MADTMNLKGANASQLAMDSRSLEDLKTASRSDRSSKQFDGAIDKVSVQFESVFLQWALKSMRDATPEGGLFTDSATKSYQSMYDQQLVQNLSGKGLGLASEIARQLKQTTEPNQTHPEKISYTEASTLRKTGR
jgi:flagellar protein FlgJ